MTDLIQSKDFRVLRKSYIEVDNRGDGNCFYDAVLDSAHIHLQPTHLLRKEYSTVLSSQRPTSDQKKLRTSIFNWFKSTKTTNKQLSNLIRTDKAWATDEIIQFVADIFDICVVLHSESDNQWTMITPQLQLEIKKCVGKAIYLRCKGSPIHGMDGGFGNHYHYVALKEISKKVPKKVTKKASVYSKIQQLPAGQRKKVSNKMIQKTLKKVIKNATKKATKKGSKKVIKDATKKVTKKGSKKAIKDATKRVTKKGSKKVIKDATKRVTKKGSKKVIKDATKKVTKKGSKKVIKDAIKKVTKKESKKVIKDATKKVTKNIPEKIRLKKASIEQSANMSPPNKQPKSMLKKKLLKVSLKKITKMSSDMRVKQKRKKRYLCSCKL